MKINETTFVFEELSPNDVQQLEDFISFFWENRKFPEPLPKFILDWVKTVGLPTPKQEFLDELQGPLFLRIAVSVINWKNKHIKEVYSELRIISSELDADLEISILDSLLFDFCHQK